MSITIVVIIVTVLVSLIALKNQQLFSNLCFHPYSIAHYKQWHRLFTYAFVHANYAHLFVNMFVLWMFGDSVEQSYQYLWGTKGLVYFLLLYLTAIAFSTLSDLRKHKDDSSYTAVGASGATSAIVFAYILLNPLNKLYIMFIPIGIPAFIFGVLYLVYCAYMDKKGNDNIGHNTHLWGAVYGFLFALFIQPRLLLAFFVEVGQLFG